GFGRRLVVGAGPFGKRPDQQLDDLDQLLEIRALPRQLVREQLVDRGDVLGRGPRRRQLRRQDRRWSVLERGRNLAAVGTVAAVAAGLARRRLDVAQAGAAETAAF